MLTNDGIKALTVKRIDDLLTANEKALLYADLAKIAATRRRGEAMAANWVMGRVSDRGDDQ